MTLSICASRERTSPSQAEGADVADVPDVPDVPAVPDEASRFFPHPVDTTSAITKAVLAPMSERRINFMTDLRNGRLKAALAL
jgi:hypothetical protein